MSVVSDLDAALVAMQNGKPPGVSGTKINFITELSVANVQSESVIIQKLYTHFKKCPGTHKLGPLYVVDSIARKYLERARASHQEVSASAPDGTYAAGVFRITNLLPPLMNDILQHAPPEENKDKIEKLVAIWERSATFPKEVLDGIKLKMLSSPMFNTPIKSPESHTPPGSPPRHPQNSFAQQAVAAAPPAPAPAQQNGSTDVASMLQAIANMAKQNQTPAVPTPPVAPVVTRPPVSQTPVVNPQQNGYPPIANPALAASSPPVSLPAAAPTYPLVPQPANSNQAFQALASQFVGAGGMPMFPLGQPSVQPTPQPGYPPFAAAQPQQQQQQQQQPPQPSQMEQLALLQLLLTQPQLQQMAAPQLAPALQALLGGLQQNGQMSMQNPADPAQQFWQQQMMNQMASAAQPNIHGSDASRPQDAYGHEQQRNRDRGYSPPPRSPPRYGSGARRGRTRSKSPDRFDRDNITRSPPSFRRRSPVYGEYEGNDAGRGSGSMGERGGAAGRGGRGRGRNRAGSPALPGGRQDHSPQGRQHGSPNTAKATVHEPEQPLPKFPKNITFDPDIGPNNVRVLSRTLFVGGVTAGEDELRGLFSNYGIVQSCIVNQDKRHAFVKMLTREDAVKAKSGMETYRTENMTLRTRWGVGFGPRDCSDYQTGVSVIPIDRLTEADQRWMVSAEYGGTGGKPLQGGMCVEEPDIEIGQGVSSKAISKRFPTDSGGNKGPRSTQEHPPKRNRKEHHHAPVPPPTVRDNVGVAPPTPGFGTGFPFAMPTMPWFPGNTGAPGR